MKTLIAFYSRTGTTKKVAEALAGKLGADLEEIKDTVDRGGVRGYLVSGKDAMMRKLTVLEPVTRNVSDYDLVIAGTPIWSWNISSPIRTYLTEQKSNFKNLAFFCTMGGSGDEKAFKEMEETSGKKPLTAASFLTREVASDNFSEKTDKFVNDINKI